jgi:hypothetical protein
MPFVWDAPIVVLFYQINFAFVLHCFNLPLLCFLVVSNNQEELKEMQCSNKEPDVI